LEKIIIISIITAANTEIGIMTVTVPIPIFLHVINYVVLYMIRKAVNYRTILKKNKKNLKLNLGLLTETSLVNLTTNSINNSINTL
jgi:multisubunit Na+/H+ antiporter MnhG subunit